MRDKRIFQAWTWFQGTFLHELGHSPVGLADEYCCDGGYFQSHPYPNIYYFKDLSSCLKLYSPLYCQQVSSCLEDPMAAGVPNACQQIQQPGDSIHWYRVESSATLRQRFDGKLARMLSTLASTRRCTATQLVF